MSDISREYPEKIYATNRVGSNGIECLDYRNYDEDVEYIKAPEKRSPDSNGVLPLEQMEFEKIRAMQKEDYSVKKVYLEGSVIMYDAYKIILGKEDKRTFIITNYKAILWLHERFELGGGE